MPRRRIDLTGQTFGRLRVLHYVAPRRWLCECECGVRTTKDSTHLRTGNTRSCGCLRVEITKMRFTTHGARRTPEYAAWVSMRRRCSEPTNKCWALYGGRGIKVCARWADDFGAFLSDMGPRPSPKHSVDRIDGDRDYEPGNCRWADDFEQNNNRSNSIKITYNGEVMLLRDAVAKAGGIVSRELARSRIWNGWTTAQAVELPKGAKRDHP